MSFDVPADAAADSSGCWKVAGACRGLDPGIFFPDFGNSPEEAKAVCRSCVVREPCLEYALEARERFGVWGGLTEKERRSILRERYGAKPNMARSPRPRRAGGTRRADRKAG